MAPPSVSTVKSENSVMGDAERDPETFDERFAVRLRRHVRGFASRLAKRLTGRFSSEPRAGGADAEPATRARGDSGAWADVDYTMDLRFEDLGLNLLSNGLQVLSGVTGSLVSRRVTAIMGPSGAGKVRARARDIAHF